jgi:Histidine kinase
MYNLSTSGAEIRIREARFPMSSLTAMPAYPRIPDELQAEARRYFRGGRAFPGGLLIIGSASLILALVTAEECHSITHLPSLIYGLVLWGWWGLIAGTLWQLGPKMPTLLNFSPLRIAVHLMAGCLVAGAHLVMLSSLSLFIPEWKVNAPLFTVLTGLLHLNRFGMEILIYGFIFGLVGIVQFQIRAQRDAMRSLELQRQLAAAHLKALQMQLEPHFLFNTLNAITTLVELGRQAQAAEMLANLNAILKRTLERNTPEKVPLSQELEIVENYLAIEQLRFADRLRVDIKVDPGALQSLVPCFLLQPIVENAIRHGIAHCENAGVVEASARKEGNRLRIAVRDSGAGATGPRTPGNGIGLTNTRERLAYFYPDAYEMEAGPLKAGGFEVAIELPYERAG